MGLFKSKAEKELDGIIHRLEMNMSNNYKDNAQDDLREFEGRLSDFRSGSEMKEATLAKYEGMLAEYKEKMKGYSHKEQKPYWH